MIQISDKFVKVLKSINNELEIAKKLRHENVLKFYGIFEGKDRIIIIMELIEGRDLYSYLKLNGVFSEEVAAKCIYQMLILLKHLKS